MSTTTDGQICFGIDLGEDYHELPWYTEEYEHDIEAWWMDVKDYKRPFKVYTEDGMDYLDGMRDDTKVKEYFRHQRDWLTSNPIPIEMVNTCSMDYPMYIIATPKSIRNVNRGYPEPFKPQELKVTLAESSALISFCKEYDIEIDSEPQWYLSSYWG